MSDTQSTIVGLKAQDCPGGGWTGMPFELERRATVSDCLANGSCGCIYGGACQHIERLVAEKQYALDLLHAAETEMARLARCINMALGCLDPHSTNADESLAWYRLHDAQCGVEPREA